MDHPPVPSRRVASFSALATISFLAYVLCQVERRAGDPSDFVELPNTIEQLQRIADDKLRVGMTISDAHRVLTAEHLICDRSSRDTNVSVSYYGHGGLSDPVLIVAFRVNGDIQWLVTDWKIEK